MAGTRLPHSSLAPLPISWPSAAAKQEIKNKKNQEKNKKEIKEKNVVKTLGAKKVIFAS